IEGKFAVLPNAALQSRNSSAIESKRIFVIKSKYHLEIRDGAIKILLLGVSDSAIVEEGRNIAVQPNCFVVILDGAFVFPPDSMGSTGRTPTNTSRLSALLLRSKPTPNSGSSMRPPTNCSSSQFHRLARFPLWAVLLARADEVIE